MDTSAPRELLFAALVGLCFPVLLLPLTRVASLRSRNALQFSLASLSAIALWLVGTLALGAEFRPSSKLEWASALMVVACFLLFYLEIWALLSRGYTLGLLVTLLNADRPLSDIDLAERYRGGSGIRWIMDHRVAGLVGARLVRRQGDALVLTRFPGVPVVLAYRLLISLLGLRSTG